MSGGGEMENEYISLAWCYFHLLYKLNTSKCHRIFECELMALFDAITRHVFSNICLQIFEVRAYTLVYQKDTYGFEVEYKFWGWM